MAAANHVIYDNFFLSSEIEWQFNTAIDMQSFFKVDTSLEGTPGMLRKINRYRASDSTEKLGMGQGNSQSIEVTFDTYDYRIELAQNKFDWYDEQAMTDDQVVPTGMKRMASGLFNIIDADFMRELKKGTNVISASSWSIDLFADAVGGLDIKGTDNDPEKMQAFCFMNPKDIAIIRKLAKETLQYNESFARQGYVGTLYGVNIYSKRNQAVGETEVALTDAVTAFVKTGVEVEQDRDPDTRHNLAWSRKYYVVALTDDTKVVKIVIGDRVTVEGTAAATELYGGKTAGDIQSNIVVSDGQITGTLNFIEGGLADSGPLADDGYFIALTQSDFPTGQTYANCKVGLRPSMGTGLVTLTDDGIMVAKIADKINQNYIVQTIQGGLTIEQEYDLSGLVFAAPAAG